MGNQPEQKAPNKTNAGNGNIMRGEGTLIQGGQDPTTTTQKSKEISEMDNQTELTHKSVAHQPGKKKGMSEEGIDEEYDALIAKKQASLGKEREQKQSAQGSRQLAQPAAQ